MMEDSIFQKRLIDLQRKAERTNQPQFSDFCTMGELTIAEQYFHNESFFTFGGSEEAERKMIGFAPSGLTLSKDEFPISLIVASPRNEKFGEPFTHRDVLGSVLALSIKREVLGDIFIDGKKAVFFCKKAMAEFIVENLIKISHTEVFCSIGETDYQNLAISFRELTETVASMRLDVILSAVFHVSRSISASDIRNDKVQKNGLSETSISATLKEGDVISYRGHGKFRLKIIGGLTKKEKTVLTVLLYQ